MSLEVKQMVVKTSIVHRSAQEEDYSTRKSRPLETSDMNQILEACRRMVKEMLSERRER